MDIQSMQQTEINFTKTKKITDLQRKLIYESFKWFNTNSLHRRNARCEKDVTNSLKRLEAATKITKNEMTKYSRSQK